MKMIHAHDQFFREAMRDPRVAKDFFVMHLPKDILKWMSFENLRLQQRSLINEVRKESIVDILYKTTIASHNAYIYLLVEHQSTPDELMPFRMLKYTCNIIDQHLRETKEKILPLVYPIVIYHAERAYPYSTNINDLVDAPKDLADKYFLKPFHLIDLGQIADEELKQHAWAGVMEFALKHIFARDILPYLQDIAAIMRRIDQAGGRDYISIVLQYILERSTLEKQEDKQLFIELINKQISPEIGGDMMTIADHFKVEGKTEAKAEMVEKLLAENMELSFIQKITGFSLEKIKEMQRSQSIHDFS